MRFFKACWHLAILKIFIEWNNFNVIAEVLRLLILKMKAPAHMADMDSTANYRLGKKSF